MVLAEVGEDRGRETATGHPLLGQGVGADLHGQPFHPAGHGLGQIVLQTVGEGSGVGCREGVARPTVLQGAEQAGHSTAMAAEVLDQVGRGGFAVGTGDPHQLQGGAGLTMQGRGQWTQPGGRVPHHRRQGLTRGSWTGCRGGFRDHTEQRPPTEGIGPEAAAIQPGSRQAHEEAAAFHPTGIGIHP